MNIRKFIEDNLLNSYYKLNSNICRKEWFIKNNFINEYNIIDTYHSWFSKYPDLKISFKINCILQDFKDEPLCPECKSPLIKNKKINNPIHLRTYCSSKCAQLSKEVKNKVKITNLKKYGVEYPSQLKEVKNKVKITNLKKYGVEYPSQLKEVREKFKNTMVEKYGVFHALQSEEIKDKIKNTCLERYGVDYALQSGEVKEKIKATNLERYGTKNPAQSEEIKDKFKEKVLEKNSKKEPLFYNKKLALEVYKEGGFELYKNSLNNEYENKWIKQRLFHLGVVDRKEFGSSFEEDVYFFIETIYNGTIIKNSYNYIKPFQLDFYLEDVNLGIECNGDYYHSSKKGTPKDYHQNKSLKCIENGISLIHIYEHEWYSEKQEEIKNSIIKLIKGEKFEYTLDCFNVNHIDKNFKYTKPLKMEHKSLTIYNSGKFIK